MRADRVVPFYGDIVVQSFAPGDMKLVDNIGGEVAEVLEEVDIKIGYGKFSATWSVENWIVLMQDGRILPVFHYDKPEEGCRPMYYISSWTFNNW